MGWNVDLDDDLMDIWGDRWAWKTAADEEPCSEEGRAGVELGAAVVAVNVAVDYAVDVAVDVVVDAAGVTGVVVRGANEGGAMVVDCVGGASVDDDAAAERVVVDEATSDDCCEAAEVRGLFDLVGSFAVGMNWMRWVGGRNCVACLVENGLQAEEAPSY